MNQKKDKSSKIRLSVFTPQQQQSKRRIRVATYPAGKIETVDLYSPLDENGELASFMRAGSDIDQKSGVYLIYEPKTGARYIGSSVGTSKQGNVRRTLARHWQSWQRNSALSPYVTKLRNGGSLAKAMESQGGVTFQRKEVLVAVWLVPNVDIVVAGNKIKAPRWVEARMYEGNQRIKPEKIKGKNAMLKMVRDNPNIPF